MSSRRIASLAATLVLSTSALSSGCAMALSAQSPKPAGAQPAPREAAEHAIPWRALDAYHTVMAASWHPAKERDDLAPFRAKATDLVAAAKALTAEPVPATCGGPARASGIAALLEASEAAARAAATPGLADAQVKAALKLAHDRFHAVEEACSTPPASPKR